MMVTFVSQCEKNALPKTRRVLDSFANRIGDNCWQTVITEEGLDAVKKLLRKTASKSTAVSCHWIRSRSRSEFLWVVGNKSKFNSIGIVPVNTTENEINQYMDKFQWQSLRIIQYAAAIAGLFHDFGKANNLFQKKLDPNAKGDISEPYRHEWVSMRLFQSFIGKKSDREWLKALSQIDRDALTICYRDGIDGSVSGNHPLNKLPPFAQLVAWLIVTHHRLPIYPKWKDTSQPEITEVDKWFKCNFDANWNSHNCNDEDRKNLLQENWRFDKGLPNKSNQWRSKACLLASEAITKLQFLKTDYLQDHLFTTHIARMCLMMADHHYSSLEKVTDEWRSDDYEAYANTNRQTKSLKQKLDEHHIGVAHHASEIVKKLPALNRSLKQLENNSALENDVEKNKKEKYGWQDKARKTVKEISKETIAQGFFGVNMASTGTGKTQANAKIMFAIGKGTGRVRFSVALGLRTLTLQTGFEYQEKLKIDEDELAVLVGGQAVIQLFENEMKKTTSVNERNNQEAFTGSESQNPLIDIDSHIVYKGDINDHSLSEWTRHDERIEKLIQAPVLVSTIDHLIPATEGTSGGKQIAPMLRLLTSDLVLDEPDDFGLEDLPALCRLVHWTGLLGSRVLLSTATMPPALAYALFEAYHAGWKQYAIVNIQDWNNKIVCAWFDEFNSVSEKCDSLNSYRNTHDSFTKKRAENIKAFVAPKRKGYISNIENDGNPIYSLAKTVHRNILNLHLAHHLTKDGKNISIGLVRMANIKPLVAVTKKLLELDSPPDTLIHYCVYHSQYPLAMRSHIETKLDKILKRHDSEIIWTLPEIAQVLHEHECNHIFVVLASPVAEVGRDHDYDWAIVEPSSMRSIVQLAGRILRHRNLLPEKPNVCLLNHNYRTLCKKTICFEKPGFESPKLQFDSHNLENLIPTDQYQSITSIPKILLTENKDDLNLIGLEQKAIATKLFGDKKEGGGAIVWWKNVVHWCGEVQRQQQFRKSGRDEAYYLFLIDSNSSERWLWKNESVYPAKFGEPLVAIKEVTLKKINQGCRFWFDLDAKSIYRNLAKDFAIELNGISRRFGEIRLVQYDEGDERGYYYHPNLGIYQEI